MELQRAPSTILSISAAKTLTQCSGTSVWAKLWNLACGGLDTEAKLVQVKHPHFGGTSEDCSTGQASDATGFLQLRISKLYAPC